MINQNWVQFFQREKPRFGASAGFTIRLNCMNITFELIWRPRGILFIGPTSLLLEISSVPSHVSMVHQGTKLLLSGVIIIQDDCNYIPLQKRSARIASRTSRAWGDEISVQHDQVKSLDNVLPYTSIAKVLVIIRYADNTYTRSTTSPRDQEPNIVALACFSGIYGIIH